jgi:hypothetical protein
MAINYQDSIGIPALTEEDLIQWGFSSTAPADVLSGYGANFGNLSTMWKNNSTTGVNVTMGGSGGSGIGYAGSPNVTWVSPTYTNSTSPNLTVEQSGKLKLAGKDPDIMLGDMSLKEAIIGIQERLGIITARPDLEERWERLRKIRAEYDACVADLVEKETIWAELKR